MSSLIERLEAAAAPDWELDVEIHVSLVGIKNAPKLLDSYPKYTASIDAALSLAHGDDMWRIGHDGEGAYPDRFKAQIVTWDNGRAFHSIHDVAPIALCIAALKARGVV